ncbi:MAG: efflux RND transporter periplasmic adaptor subunit [Enterobacteriaceae bacterium]
MKKNRELTSPAMGLIVAMTLLLSGCDNAGQKPGEPPAPEVEVTTLKAAPLNVTTELPGRTSPWRVAEVRPQVSGIILKRNFVEGSDVKAGDSLYQIDPASYQATYDQAKGDLAKAQASAKIAQLTVNRYKPLLGTNYISRQDYDSAVATLNQANATVLSAKANVEQAKINLAYTQVKAPISGRIGISSFTEGALVTSGQPNALASVQQLDPMYVDITQSSVNYLRLKQELAAGTLKQVNGKASVSLKLEDGSVYPQKGELEFSDVTVDETTGSITLRALFPNPDKTLLPGMFVRSILDEGLKPDAMLVSQRGVTRNPQGQAVVMVVNKEGKVERKIIEVGQAVGDQWLVTGGLQPGDQVIITGLMKIREGMPVKVKEYQESGTAAK